MAATRDNLRAQEFETLARAKAGANGNGDRSANGHGDGAVDIRIVAGDAGLAMLASASAHTAEHSDDVVLVAEAICDELGIAGADRDDLLLAARLHDIGKTSLPGELLDKAGPLTDDEWALMRDHTIAGERILATVPELANVGILVRYSHERWDGAGYPDGLAGEEIPLASRVIFCADAFHAIRCDRPYRAGRAAEAALAEVREHSGTQFDPAVVDALVSATRKLKLVPAPGRVARKSRLAALLMVLAVGATGSAVGAEMGLFDGSEPPSPPPPGSTVCEPVECPDLSVAPVAGRFGIDGVRPDGPADPAGLNGSEDAGAEAPTGSDLEAIGAPEGGVTGQDPSGQQSLPSGGSGTGASQGGGASSGKEDAQGGGGQNGASSGGKDHPHGGPPGLAKKDPAGVPPGQAKKDPAGSPPGQSGSSGQASGNGPGGGGPPGQSGQPADGPPGQSNGNGPGGNGPPGQAKKS